ncbi:hypothetical protein HDU86_000484 [Geranomyces michiganensis]|nr:hypothetical protein HDU86_000484 [Geranomyces michiganensis]
MEEIRAIFPETDPEVCQAILDANGGNVEAAINAMLEMSNPTATAATPRSPADANFTVVCAPKVMGVGISVSYVRTVLILCNSSPYKTMKPSPVH